MPNHYYFDKVARAERYFVASLFAHFLLSNNFAGLQKLFRHVFGEEACAGLADEFELVSELDPIRDGSVYSPDVKKLYREFRRIAVPDLFLRWDNLCFIIEAKFFTDPSAEELTEQIKLQQEALERVKPFTAYHACEIKFGVLSVAGNKKLGQMVVLTWAEIIRMMKDTDARPLDLAYCIDILQRAEDRALQELKTTPPSYEKLSFAQLLAELPRLIAQGKIFIGYTGGIEALATATHQTLVDRSHYKVSDIQWSDNWITLDQFLHQVFEVRGYYETPTEEE